MTIVVGKTKALCPVCSGFGAVGDRHDRAGDPCLACGGSGEIAQAEHVAAGEEPSA